MENIIKTAKDTHIINKEDLIKLLSTNKFDNLLYKTADEVRKKYVGDDIHLRALIEFSNICQNNCLYCGIRAENNLIHRYKLTIDEIIHAANQAYALGFKTVVLQSGEANIFSDLEMIKIISEIKKNDIIVTLSIGEKTFEQYKKYKDAGADRFLLRIETTDKNLYQTMHPKMSFENRINCLKNLKKLGYETGTGCLVGLKGQTISSLADDILFFKELNADMIGLGPFITTKNTPLENEQNGSFEMARKMIALTRILMPKINIPATTAMETIKQDGRILALQSGANVVMPNITPQKCRHNYSIYTDKSSIDANNLEQLKQEAKKLNRILQ